MTTVLKTQEKTIEALTTSGEWEYFRHWLWEDAGEYLADVVIERGVISNQHQSHDASSKTAGSSALRPLLETFHSSKPREREGKRERELHQDIQGTQSDMRLQTVILLCWVIVSRGVATNKRDL